MSETTITQDLVSDSRHREFVASFNEMISEVHHINEEHGFNEDDHLLDSIMDYLNDRFAELGANLKRARMGLKLMLIVSELSEALESIRKNDQPDSHIPEFTGAEAELADAVIRIMNMAHDYGYRVAEAIVAKSVYNAARPFKHGGKKF